MTEQQAQPQETSGQVVPGPWANGNGSVQEGCCPGREDGPGLPDTPHYLAQHKGGSLSLKGTAGRLPVSELGAVQLLDSMNRDAGRRMIYGYQTRRWMTWDGAVYAPQDVTNAGRMAEWFAGAYSVLLREVRQAARCEAVRELGPDAKDAELDTAADAKLEAFAGHRAYCAKLWTERGQAALIRQAERTCGVDDAQLDVGTGEITLDNGRISYAQILRDHRVTLLPHDPGQLITKRMGKGVRYDAEAECPAFDHFLATSVADPDQRGWLLWRTASALFGRMPRKGFINPVGEHDSGKSTYTRIIGLLAGSYATAVESRTFMVKRSGGDFLAAELRGARFVSSHEPDPGARFDVGYMKTITSREDSQRTADKYEKSVQWVPQCTVFLGSNAPVRFSTADEAMVMRHEPIRFARGYAEMDDGLGAKLQAELPGILNRLLSCVLAEAVQGAPPSLPGSVVSERERLATETEPALQFVAEATENGWLLDVPPGQVAVSNCAQVTWLFRQFEVWCGEEGIQSQIGRTMFSQIVGRRWKVKPSNGKRFHGLVPAPGTWRP